jgi:hypothetical protein
VYNNKSFRFLVSHAALLALVLAALAGATLWGCSDQKGALRVRFNATQEVAEAMRWLKLQVRAEGGETVWSEQWDFNFGLPAHVTLREGSHHKVSLEALALNGAEQPISRAVAEVTFTKGETKWVDLNFEECPFCKNVPVPDGGPGNDGGPETGPETGPSDAEPDGNDGETGPTGIFYYNPGCDPVVRAQGIDAAWTKTTGTTEGGLGELLYVTQGTRMWALYFPTPGDFSTAEWDRHELAQPDIGKFWREEFGPDNDANPGRDSLVRSSGITAAWVLDYEGSERYLMVLAGARFFTLDWTQQGLWLDGAGRKGLFNEWLAANATIPQPSTGPEPDGGTLPLSCPGGDATRNPGEDSIISSVGPTAISRYNVYGALRITAGTAYWGGSYDATDFSYHFNCTFDNVGRFFETASPSCTSEEDVNPGCDDVVAQDGIDASYWTNDGVFHVTQGIRHWGFVVGAYNQWLPEQHTNDLPAYWAENTEPGCSEFETITP